MVSEISSKDDKNQFPILPFNWQLTKIICILNSLESGGRPKGGVRGIDSGIPSIGGEHLTYSGNFDFTNIRYIPLSFYEKMNKGKIQKKDVLVVKDGATTGKTSYVSENFAHTEAAVNEHIFILRVFHDYFSSKFLFYWFMSPFGQNCIKENFQGTAQGGITSNFIENSRLQVAPLAEQHRIVTKIEELLTQLDAGVASLKKVEAQLKRYRQSVLKAAFEGRLTQDWREVHKEEIEPASTLIDRINQARKKVASNKNDETPIDSTDLPPLPDNWRWIRLDNIVHIKGGITKDRKRIVENGRLIPYLRVANVQNGYLDLNEMKTIEADEAEIKDLSLKFGDILFTEGGDRDKLGRGWIWQYEIPECIYQNHIFRARVYLNEISSKYISWFGNTHSQKYFMKKGKQTTNLASISLTQLRAFPVAFPPAEEQQTIVTEIERYFSQIDHLEQTITISLRQAESLRQSLLKRAFEGKLVPQDPNDEPASILLERIKAEKARYATETKKGKTLQSSSPKRKIKNGN